MGLKEGTLESIIKSSDGFSTSIADFLFPQMLQALDCLAYNGIIYRDVKLENILYTSQPGGQYQFQLGDFGLCNRVVDASAFAGSYIYMAPEMFRKGGQTSKLDVWSLFVTMSWTLDAGAFRQKSNLFKCVEDAQEAVLHIASNIDTVSRIQEMAAVNPKERASAAQILVKYYNGVGLSTPRNQVPDLVNSPTPVIATARGTKLPDPAFPPSTTRTTQTKLRGFQKNGNTFAAAAQYRVKKARNPFSAQQAPRQLQGLRLKPAKN